jgi:hypothetical protein
MTLRYMRRAARCARPEGTVRNFVCEDVGGSRGRRGAATGYLAKRAGLAAWGCRHEPQREHHALSRRVAGEQSEISGDAHGATIRTRYRRTLDLCRMQV